MKIVIDGRFWKESGIGRYIRNLVKELECIDNKNDYFILLLKDSYDTLEFKNKKFHKVLADFSWYGASEQLKLPKLLKSLQPDLVHFPHFNIPVFYKGKFVVTVHDLIHQHFQTRQTTTKNFLVHGIKKAGYGLVFSQAVKKATKIITPSQFVKEQLMEQWHIDKSKIIVTYEAVDEKIINLAKNLDQAIFEKISLKFNLKNPYLFYVGNAQPHKNLVKLINAFNILKKTHQDLNLVLSGPNNYFWQKIKKEHQVENVIFTGLLTEEELVALYKNAQAFILPSLEEGFGIPILEAMACGCAVVSSNAASLPEVGGDTALYFNPSNVQDMANKINQVLDDKKLRQEMIEKGQKRYEYFSWNKLAKQTLEVYQ